jgi:hypothetical protein
MPQVSTLSREVVNTLPNSAVVVAIINTATVVFILTIVVWENCQLS